MRKDTSNLRMLAMASLAACALSANAQIAFDSASDPVYTLGQEYIQVGTPPGDQTAATNGLNGGTGWNAWQRGGYGDPPNNGTTLITGLAPSFNMGTQQFGVRSGANGQNGADARRRLLNPLQVGQGFKWIMMAGGGGAGTANTQGEFGAEIRSGLLSNPGRDMLNIIGEPGRNWRVFRSGGTIESATPVTAGQRVDVEFWVLPGNQFSVTFTPFGGSGSTVNGTFLSNNQLPQTLQFYAFGTNGDFYVNNIAAVPEPASVLALGGLVALTLRRRTRR